MSKIFLCVIFLTVGPILGCEHKSKTEAVQQDLDALKQKIEPMKTLSERQLNGPVLMYYDNGQLKAERTYKDAKLDGIYRMYYDNGQVKVEGTYKGDKMDGVFRRYDPHGKLQVEEVYQDHLLITRKVFNNS